MLYKIATILANKLRNHYQSSKYSIAVYIYGIELLISFLFSISVMLLTSSILGKTRITIAFLGVFLPMRTLCGGFHAKTFLKCFMYTNLTHICVLGLICILIKIDTIFVPTVILVLADFWIALFAPVKSKKMQRLIKNI